MSFPPRRCIWTDSHAGHWSGSPIMGEMLEVSHALAGQHDEWSRLTELSPFSCRAGLLDAVHPST